ALTPSLPANLAITPVVIAPSCASVLRGVWTSVRGTSAPPNSPSAAPMAAVVRRSRRFSPPQADGFTSRLFFFLRNHMDSASSYLQRGVSLATMPDLEICRLAKIMPYLSACLVHTLRSSLLLLRRGGWTGTVWPCCSAWSVWHFVWSLSCGAWRLRSNHQEYPGFCITLPPEHRERIA